MTKKVSPRQEHLPLACAPHKPLASVGITWLVNGKSSCKPNQGLCQQGGKGRLPNNGLELRTVR